MVLKGPEISRIFAGVGAGGGCGAGADAGAFGLLKTTRAEIPLRAPVLSYTVESNAPLFECILHSKE